MSLRRGSRSQLTLVALSTAIALGVLWLVFVWIDPFPPRHFLLATAMPGTPSDGYAQRYARILARSGVTLDIENDLGALESLDRLRDADSGVQAAIATYVFVRPEDAQSLSSLGGVGDSPLFVFYRSDDAIDRFSQLRGKTIAVGPARSALSRLLPDVLRATGALDPSTRLVEMEFGESFDALVAGKVDAAILPIPLDDALVHRAFATPGIRLMNVGQAEAIARRFAGLRHVVLPRAVLGLEDDVPATSVDMLAIRTQLVVRRDLHPALQYLLLEAMREVHAAPGPLADVGDFSATQAGELPLTATAQAFYRSGPNAWQSQLAFWLTSLLNRIVFFVIPVVATLIPLLGVAPRVYRWYRLRPIRRLHRAVARVDDRLRGPADAQGVAERGRELDRIDEEIDRLPVSRTVEVDLQLLRVHLRMVREAVERMTAGGPSR